MQPLSVFLITKNEEQRLPATLEAVREIASEIIILDSGSTDRTKEISETYGAKFHFRAFDGFGQQKFAAQELCENDWVLNIDADEVVTDKLKTEIKTFLNKPEMTTQYDGGEIKITSVLPGRNQPHTFARTYERIRFYNKTKLSFPTHSTFDNIDRKPEYTIHEFEGIIHHYSYLSLPELDKKARERVKFYFEEEKKGSALKNIIRLPFEFIISFIKCYVFRGHFADGFYGIGNAFIYAKYRHIRILQRVLNRPIID